MVAANRSGLRSGAYMPGGVAPQVRDRAALALLILLFVSILLLWVPNRWPLGLFQAGVFTVTIWIIVHVALRPSGFRGSLLLVPLGGVLGLGCLQIAARQTSDAWATRAALLAWAANASLVFLALQLFAERKARQRFLQSIFYFGFAISVLAVTQLWTSPGKVFWLFPTGYADTVMGPFVSRNLYAAFIELLLPIGLVYAAFGRRVWMHAAMCGVMFASVVAGASRAGVVLVSAEVMAALLLTQTHRIGITRGLAATVGRIAVPCVLFIALFGGTALWRRFQEEDPYGVRRQLLRSSLDMVYERPWIGFGLGTWSIVYPRFAYYDDGTVANHAHNDWAEWSAEGGLACFTMMLWLAAMTLRPAVRSVWGIGVIAVWLHCVVDFPLQNPFMAGWFFLAAGILAAGGSQSGEPEATAR
jgi:O-antigen ligase